MRLSSFFLGAGLAVALSVQAVAATVSTVGPPTGYTTAGVPVPTTGVIGTDFIVRSEAALNDDQAANPLSPFGLTGTFMSVLGGHSVTFATNLEMFSAGTGFIQFLWGSIDPGTTWNVLTLNTTAGIQYIYGGDVAGANSALNALVKIAYTGTLNSLTFSAGTNSFEFATVSGSRADVPGPLAGAGLPALLAALGYLGYLKSRKAA